VSALPDPGTFLSGQTGHVAGARQTLVRRGGDLLLDLRARADGSGRRLDELAARVPERSVLALCVYRRANVDGALAAARELRAGRHRVRLVFGAIGQADPALAGETAASGLAGGKFENLNALLAGAPAADWTLIVDDDVGLPHGFMDRFLGACEGFGFAIAQPAQTLMSHAAWDVTRRRGGSLARETRFVEIGPVTAFRRDAAEALLPFPELRFGWGLDLHWSAVAAERGWRLGVIDALPVQHERSPVASSYPYADAIEEARRFLASRPYVTSAEAQRTVAVHRRAPG
jgi:hypothetical protein